MNNPTTPHSNALTFEGLVTAIGQAHAVLAQQASNPTPWRTELLAGLPIIIGLAIRQH